MGYGMTDDFVEMRQERDDIRAKLAAAESRIEDVRSWATSRVEHCRREEEKFGAGSVAVEASTERRALQTVLRMLLPAKGDK